MMISTRGRYALRVLIDMAETKDAGYVPMKEVAERQQISLKYLERILPVLVQNGILEGMHGHGGGYRLVRKPEEVTVGEILRLTEGDLAPVACLTCDSTPCDRKAECRTYPMWTHLNELITGYLDSVSLSDLMKMEKP